MRASSAWALVGLTALVSAEQTPVRTVDQSSGNIQVLRGLPASELLPTMHFFRASLGVRCEYCHVAENDKYRLDDKPAKQRAREMILMTQRLNDTSFGGRPVVTCQTCHQGSTVPASVPPIGSHFVNDVRREPDEPVVPPLPSVSSLLDRYARATRMSEMAAVKVTLNGCHMHVADPGTPRARAIARADCNGGDVVLSGDKAVTTSKTADGGSIRVGSDGRRAWTMPSGGAVQWVPDADFTTFQRKLNPFLVARVRTSDFTSLEVVRVEAIAGHDQYVLDGVGTDGVRESLWFAKDTGLLTRRTYYHAIAIGLDPEQIDLADYRRTGAVLLPWRLNTSYLDDQHLGVLKTIRTVERLAVPPPDSDFLPGGGPK